MRLLGRLKMFKGVFALLMVAAIATWNATLENKFEGMFDVRLAGNEALAISEDPDTNCFTKVTMETDDWGYGCNNVWKPHLVYWEYRCLEGTSGSCDDGGEIEYYDCYGNYEYTKGVVWIIQCK